MAHFREEASLISRARILREVEQEGHGPHSAHGPYQNLKTPWDRRLLHTEGSLAHFISRSPAGRVTGMDNHVASIFGPGHTPKPPPENRCVRWSAIHEAEAGTKTDCRDNQQNENPRDPTHGAPRGSLEPHESQESGPTIVVLRPEGSALIKAKLRPLCLLLAQ
jgi:hypothetical protein